MYMLIFARFEVRRRQVCNSRDTNTFNFNLKKRDREKIDQKNLEDQKAS